MVLEVSAQLALGALDLDLALDVGEEVVAVLGPNGAGKSTLLRLVAGLQSLDAGRIAFDGEVYDDGRTSRPPQDRSIGMVFQDHLLFPFLSARENVAFPLRARRVPKRAALARADEWLDRVGLADRAGARPADLSGGQAQRVALARALVDEPRVLLLDEPLAALDAGTRIDVRRQLRSHLRAGPGARVLVTHDPVDASVLADRVVILEGGRIVQSGTMDAIAAHPRSRYVADLVGLNLWRGVARDGVVEIDGGQGSIVIADHSIAGPVLVVLHPRAVTLHAAPPGGSPRNHWDGRVVELDLLGDRVRVRLDGPVPLVAEVTREAVSELGLAVGGSVVAVAKASELRVDAV